MDTSALEQSIDPREVLAALGYRPAGEPVRIRGGWDTLLWRFQSPDGAEHSLRLYILAEREEMVERERIALRGCEEAGFPAPRIERIDRFRDLPVAVLSWCPGLPILSRVEQKPWAIWRLSRLFGRTHARLHAIAPPEEFAANSRELLTRVPSEYAALSDHAASLGFAADCLAHMDFHPLNVISDGTGVTGVVDWGGAAAGDRRGDLARTEVTLATAPVPPGPMKPLFSMMRGVMLRAWRAGYREVAGAVPDYRPLRAWAAATLLLEVIRVIDREAVWATERYVDELHQYTREAARRSGIALPSRPTASGRA